VGVIWVLSAYAVPSVKDRRAIATTFFIFVPFINPATCAKNRLLSSLTAETLFRISEHKAARSVPRRRLLIP
jgi:hypothetical protein